MRNRMEEILGAVDNGQRHDASAAACWRLTGLDAFLHASVVMLYTPLAHDVDLTAAALCCFRNGKTVCVPRVNRNGRDLDPVEVTSFDDEAGAADDRGLTTPWIGAPLPPSMIDLVVVPGLGFWPSLTLTLRNHVSIRSATG